MTSTTLIALCSAAVLLVPGYLLLRTYGLNRSWSACAAPGATLALYAVLGETLYRLGIPASPWTLCIVPCVGLCAAAVVRQAGKEQASTSLAPWQILPYVLISLTVVWLVFYRRIPLDSTYMEYYDNVFHYTEIRCMAESGIFSTLDAPKYYATAVDIAIAPQAVSRGFYPLAWHMVCALVLQITGAPLAAIVNIVNWLTCGMVFPLGMALLNDAVSPGRPYTHAAGALCAVALAEFPWLLVFLWPLFPNSLGLALIPAAAGLFVAALHTWDQTPELLRLLAGFALVLIGLGTAHPNAVFTLVVLLAPYCVARLLATPTLRLGKLRIPGSLAGAVFVAFFCVGWYLLFSHPSFAGVVWFNWTTDIPPIQAIANVADLGYLHTYAMDKPQILLSVLLVIGALHTLRAKNGRWLLGSYGLACLILLGELVLADDNWVKHLLGGFWYTDPFRIAASTAICAVPLVSMGLASVFVWLDKRLQSDAHEGRGTALRSAAIAAASLAFLAMNYLPQYPLLQRMGIGTAFGDYRAHADYIAHNVDVFDRDELDFVQTATELIPKDAVVINYPYDGSNFAYGATGMRTVYRFIQGYDDYEETWQSAALRSSLRDIAYDEEVQRAVASLGDCYVLLLGESEGLLDDGTGNYLGAVYDPENWHGITDITDDTPGFELVLAQGELRLYRALPEGSI